MGCCWRSGSFRDLEHSNLRRKPGVSTLKSHQGFNRHTNSTAFIADSESSSSSSIDSSQILSFTTYLARANVSRVGSASSSLPWLQFSPGEPSDLTAMDNNSQG